LTCTVVLCSFKESIHAKRAETAFSVHFVAEFSPFSEEKGRKSLEVKLRDDTLGAH
jgi:hypothetical protein